MKNNYQGECLCGAVRYVITAPAPSKMFLCHCSRCRKETGTIHGANVFFPEGELCWERGEDLLKFFQLAGSRKARQFCSTCASPLPRTTPDGRIVLPAGSLDDDSSLEPTAHIFCASGSAWEAKVEGLTRYDELPD